MFFAVKDAAKQQLGPSLGAGTLTTLIAVASANVPYWVVRNPTEVIKARRQAGQVVDARLAAQELWSEVGVGGFYRGYASNISHTPSLWTPLSLSYTTPSSRSSGARKPDGSKLTPLEAAVGGAFASSCAQAVSTPLDVVRTRIMTARPDVPASGVLDSLRSIAASEGVGALYAGVTPKVARAIVSGALQFSVLEGVKDAVNYAILGRAQQ